MQKLRVEDDLTVNGCNNLFLVMSTNYSSKILVFLLLILANQWLHFLLSKKIVKQV